MTLRHSGKIILIPDSIGVIMASKLTDRGQIDGFDLKILKEVSEDGRVSVTELADRVGLSKSPTQVRLRRLEQEGYIRGYRAELDPVKLDREHVAFVEVKLSDTREAALAAFNKATIGVAEIEECHMIAGAFDYLVKVRCRDMRAYRRVLGEVLSSLPHVASTSTHVSMQAVKDRAF